MGNDIENDCDDTYETDTHDREVEQHASVLDTNVLSENRQEKHHMLILVTQEKKN